MSIPSYKQAVKFLADHKPVSTKRLFQGGKGLARTKYLLNLIGNPQNKIKIVHVAGTSGKSSTSFILSSLLISQQYKTGLFISPHVVDLRERIQINNKYIEKEKFCKYLSEIVPFINQTTESSHGIPTFFEILTCLAFYFFWKEEVDYAVIETGLGGLLDATNAADAEGKICVITRIGLDHTEILGKTLTDIAWQKCGIFSKKSLIFTVGQELEIENIIKQETKKKHSELFIIRSDLNFKVNKEGITNMSFNFGFDDLILENVSLSLRGAYQAENCALGLAVLCSISKQSKIPIDVQKVRYTLKNIFFFGRFNIISINRKNIIIDGAHNQQKMEVFVDAVKYLFPNKKFDFLIAFTNTKDFKPMLELIIPIADKIVITSFKNDSQDLKHESVKPKNILKILKGMEYVNATKISNHIKAYDQLLHSNSENDIIITGSFYLINELNEKFKS